MQENHVVNRFSVWLSGQPYCKQAQQTMQLAYLFRLCRTITTKSRAPNVFVADLFNTNAPSPDENEIDDTSSNINNNSNNENENNPIK